MDTLFSGGGSASYNSSSSVIDFSMISNPVAPPENVAEAITASIPQISFFPDGSCTELRTAIAELEGVNPDNIFCGNGASDVMFRLSAALKPKRILTTTPNNSALTRALLSQSVRVETHQLTELNGFYLDDSFLDTLRGGDFSAVFLSNPNMPTGVILDIKLLEAIITYCDSYGIYIIIDESFLDFVGDSKVFSAKRFLGTYNRLIIVKSLSDTFALPGIPLGYLISVSKRLMNSLNGGGLNDTISCIAQAAGIAAAGSSKDYLSQCVEYVSRERRIIKNALSKMGYIVFDSVANYVFFKSEFPFDLGEKLAKERIYISNYADVPSLGKNCYSIAIQNSGKNILLHSKVNPKNYLK